ncbi:MAG: redox-regulated ATPase YchF [Nanobdellota archaeon]
MNIGIVGKPSVGKSTFFKAATLAQVDIANYPFTTIQANKAVGFVKIPDVAREFDKQANPGAGYVHGSWRFVPVDLLDVAGLVPGAHNGEGMGSQFLDDLNQADALIHVIDASGSVNEKGEPVTPGSYDPCNDVRFLELELDYWYKNILTKGWEKFTRVIQQEKKEFHKAIAKQMSGVGVDEDIAKNSIQEAKLFNKEPSVWTDDDLLLVSKYLRKRTKPMIIAANKSDHPKAKEHLKNLKDEFPSYTIIPCSAEGELALKEANKQELVEYIPGENSFNITSVGETELQDKQRQALDFLKKNLLETSEYGSGVQQVLNTIVFEILNMKAIHPGGVSKLEDQHGNVLPDCFLMEHDATAIDFAYRLHSSFGDNFVKAIDVRTKRPVGKDHLLKHLDIIEIMAGK